MEQKELKEVDLQLIFFLFLIKDVVKVDFGNH